MWERTCPTGDEREPVSIDQHVASRPTARPDAAWESGWPTLPQLLLRWEQITPGRVALRRKELGRWREITYAEWAEQTRIAGAGLHSLGLAPGDRLAIHSENRPEWLYACIAAQGLGAIAFGIYPTNAASELRYQLTDAGARMLVSEDQEQLDKAVAVADEVPTIEHIIVLDHDGTTGPAYDDPRILHWDDVLERGRTELAAAPRCWDDATAAAQPDDTAVIIYTSGTTGPPKGAMLSWRNIVFAIRMESGFYGVNPADEVLSYLPLCHVAEQVMSLYNGLGCGVRVNFAESVDTVQSDLREVRPTVLFAVPRITEKLLASVEMRVADATRFKQANYRLWKRVGTWLAARRLSRVPHQVRWYEQPVRWLTWLFLFRSIKKHTGLSRVRLGLSAGAPISPEVLFFFRAMDIPITEAYGQTECTGFATANRLDDMALGTVGRPFPGIEIRLADDGEILVQGEGVFTGYWQRSDATAETIDADGWLHTGNVGEWTDDGRLKITDRKKDIIITSGGKNLSPSEIENRLKVSPFVKEAIAIGDGRRYVTALVQIEYDTVSDWAKRRNLPFTTYRDLTEKEEVVDLIRGVVREANEDLARVEEIKRFRLLPRELDQDDDEVTATQKVRRKVVTEQFGNLIEEMYRS